MEHDRRCEKQKILEEWKKTPEARDEFVRLLRDAEDLCACQARTWGMVISLEVGLRIAGKKAMKLWLMWMEVQEHGVEEGARRLSEKYADQVSGRNVINLQDFRDR